MQGDNEMGFGGGAPKFSPPPPQPLPRQPMLEGPEEREARKRQAMALAALRGRKGTMLTGSMGLTTPAPVQVKKLFGE